MTKPLIYLFLFLSQLLVSQVSETTLNASWKFKQNGTDKYYNAIVPGTVHTDLLNNQLIKDPFLADNEKAEFITGVNYIVDGGMTIKMIYAE